MTDLDIIQPGIPDSDGCPVLCRVKAFLSSQGVVSTLEFTFRDGKGNPVDLRQGHSFINVSEGSAASQSEPYPDPLATILVKFREISGVFGRSLSPVYHVEGTIYDAANGVVRAKIPQAIAGQSGIYQMSWGFVLDNDLKFVNPGLLSIERTLFGFATPGQPFIGEGSPTVNEVRMQMWDTDPEHKRLDEVEFGDEQIVNALVKPIQYFNATNPPINVHFDTRGFPWRHEWIDATIGYLYEYAAMYYKRQRLSVQSGGKMLDEFDRQRISDYGEVAKEKNEMWRDFVFKKKIEINAAACVGTMGSVYGR